jgi:hypothetical protein
MHCCPLAPQQVWERVQNRSPRALRAFAESRRLPVIAENCPACFAAPQQRQRLKRLLAEQELLRRSQLEAQRRLMLA